MDAVFESPPSNPEFNQLTPSLYGLRHMAQTVHLLTASMRLSSHKAIISCGGVFPYGGVSIIRTAF